MKALDLKFRIGTKLAISAAIGVVLVGVMLVSQKLGNSAMDHSIEEAIAQRKLSQIATDMKASVRGMMVGVRDLRLAQTGEDLKKAQAYLQARDESVLRFINEALKIVQLPEDRERLERAKKLSDFYKSVGKEIAAAKEELFALGGKMNGNAWRAQYSTVIKSQEFAKSSKAREIETALVEAADLFNDARTAGWRFAATSDLAQVARANGGSDKANERLRKLSGELEDKALARLVDGLIKPVTDYKTIMNRYAEVSQQVAALVRDKGLPTANEMGAIADKIVEAAIRNAESAAATASSTMTSVERLAMGLGVFVVVVLIGSAVFGALSIARPIRRIADVLLALGSGNKQVDVPYVGRGDEVGDAANAANTFKENLIRIEKMEAEQKETELRAAARRKADMHKLADEFQAAVGNIVETVSSASTELEAAAGTLTKTAEVAQELSGTVAAASEQASANVQSVASATEEMTSSVTEISRQVQESARIAGDAVKQAQQTDQRISALSQAAGRIGDVVKLITAIAEQTNLLALNATIEAARAGEAGRGFAVVASEVKQLASQTAKATDEISSQIAGMQTATQESVASIKEIGGTIGRISQIASTIAAAVEEQGAATQEIARNVGEAAKGTAQVAANITDVNRGAGETGSASSQVLSSAQSLSSESNHLKMEVDKFLSTVRAA